MELSLPRPPLFKFYHGGTTNLPPDATPIPGVAPMILRIWIGGISWTSGEMGSIIFFWHPRTFCPAQFSAPAKMAVRSLVLLAAASNLGSALAAPPMMEIRDAVPHYPSYPDTTSYCSWWWDNDGSISCEEMPDAWGFTWDDFVRWVSYLALLTLAPCNKLHNVSNPVLRTRLWMLAVAPTRHLCHSVREIFDAEDVGLPCRAQN
jgi:hypothetical protein